MIFNILLAVESGSRAWGFHSPDSDYDVRFVYARPVDWHLSLHKKRDVVERPVDDDWDLSGWELAKALNLALSSNAVIAEWLQSPIVYQEAAGFREEMTRFCESALNRKSVTWHYLSLLRRQSERSTDSNGNVRLKKYFYMLRPALALRWMRVNQANMPPMNMAELMAGCELDEGATSAILSLIEDKKSISERGAVATVDPLLDELIETEWAAAKTWVSEAGKPPVNELLLPLGSEINMRWTHNFTI